MDREKRYFGGWWLWITLLLALSILIIGLVGYVTIAGRTVGERIIFEQSFQRKAGDRERFRLLQAELANIEQQLKRTDLTEGQRANLRGQRSALKIRLQATGD